MLRTTTQNKRLHAIIGALNINTDHKAELVLSATNGRTGSSAEMETMECEQLIAHLQAIKKRMEANPGPLTPKGGMKDGDKLRKKVLSLCYELGWTMNGKVDYERLNAFLMARGHPKKENLNAYTIQELPGLITQFETIFKKGFKK